MNGIGMITHRESQGIEDWFNNGLPQRGQEGFPSTTIPLHAMALPFFTNEALQCVLKISRSLQSEMGERDMNDTVYIGEHNQCITATFGSVQYDHRTSIR